MQYELNSADISTAFIIFIFHHVFAPSPVKKESLTFSQIPCLYFLFLVSFHPLKAFLLLITDPTPLLVCVYLQATVQATVQTQN